MMEWLTTSTILHELGDYQNRQAWTRFVERFREPVVRFARTLGLSAIDAEDVAQETLIAFAEAYRRGEYNREQGRLGRWLFGIAFRQGLRGRRIQSRQPLQAATESKSWSQFADEKEVAVSWDQSWETSVLEVCLEQAKKEVEPLTFSAFELVVRGQRSAAEAASELGISVKTIYNAKHRVLKRVRELRDEFEIVK